MDYIYDSFCKVFLENVVSKSGNVKKALREFIPNKRKYPIIIKVSREIKFCNSIEFCNINPILLKFYFIWGLYSKKN